MNITTVGIDIAKNVFQVHAVDRRGKKIFSKKIKREELLPTIANLPKCLIGMEACASAHHWAREMTKLGHTVKLMSPQYVKPYIKRNKNDRNDAEGICEAVTRPSMRYVKIKTLEQQDIKMLHKIRERLVKQRTEIQNEMRGFLGEYGFAIARGRASLRGEIPDIIENKKKRLSEESRENFQELYEELCELEKRIEKFNTKIKVLVKQDERCQRLQTIPGIGELTATAIVAEIGDAEGFEKGRQLSAFLGLVPKQHSSGGKDLLLGISKQGNRYIRKLLVHGARAVVRVAEKKQDKKSLWIQELLKRRGINRTVVAVANKNARIAWALLHHKMIYQTDYKADEATLIS